MYNLTYNFTLINKSHRYQHYFLQKPKIVFANVQEFKSRENNIKYIGDNFYKPDGYIENRDWLENEINSYQTFSYEDINRMIIDMRLLYNVREEQVTIWNGQTFVNWEIESDLEWEEY